MEKLSKILDNPQILSLIELSAKEYNHLGDNPQKDEMREKHIRDSAFLCNYVQKDESPYLAHYNSLIEKQNQ